MEANFCEICGRVMDEDAAYFIQIGPKKSERLISNDSARVSIEVHRNCAIEIAKYVRKNMTSVFYPNLDSLPNEDDLVQEIIDGKWGNAKEQKTRLTAAGYDYQRLKVKVNEKLGLSGYDY